MQDNQDFLLPAQKPFSSKIPYMRWASLDVLCIFILF